MRLLNLIGPGLCLATAAATCMEAVGRECGDLGPPPSILDMPPPPMPSFLTHIVDDQSGSNGSNSPNKDLLMETNELDPGKPCKSMCDTDQGVGFVELPQQGPLIETYSWWMLLSTCLLGVMLIGTVVLVVVVRLKDKKRWSKSDFSPEPKKSPPLYDTIAEMSPKSFWATLSPTGNIDTTATATTRSASRSRPVHHHPQTIANPNFENGAYYPFERQHHHHRHHNHHHQLQNHQQLQSFHNHQQQQQQQQQQVQEHEYQQITTIRRTMEQPEYQTIRPHVSSPTRIEHPNMPPLNLYRSIRRISDLESP